MKISRKKPGEVGKRRLFLRLEVEPVDNVIGLAILVDVLVDVVGNLVVEIEVIRP